MLNQNNTCNWEISHSNHLSLRTSNSLGTDNRKRNADETLNRDNPVGIVSVGKRPRIASNI